MIEDFPDQQVYWGAQGSVSFLRDKLSMKGYRRIFLVSGRKSYFSSGAEQFIADALDGITILRHCDFSPNPTLEDLVLGLKNVAEYNPDCIIAIGGGSVMDMAKLLNFFSMSSLDPADYLDAKHEYSGGNLLPLIAIPTTAGTGSEATHFSVLYRNKVKFSVAEACMIPDFVILNPELTYAMDAYQTACTGMDALAQGIESMWATGATEDSRLYARKGISLALASLEAAVKNPSRDSRLKMQEAAYWSGRAINISKTTLCHALSYTMTSYYGYPHGHALALFLPEIFRAHEKRAAIPSEIHEIFESSTPGVIIDHLVESVELGCNYSLNDSDVKRVVSGINQDRLSNNPVQFTEDELFEIVLISLHSG